MPTNAARAPAVISERTIARPLKTLIPMIQSELQQGNSAGHEHYCRAGEMLKEAQDQVGYGGWVKWLSKNFDLSRQTAALYMRWAREAKLSGGARQVPYRSMRDMTGHTEREREDRQSTQHQAFKRVLRDVARDDFVQERLARDAEIKLHRDLCEELVDIGFKGLATKLHPDRGGSKDAMARLNRVRAVLLAFIKTQRFI
jgi:hypothetical protein